MNDGLLRVDFGALIQASADIQKAVNELEAQLSQLESDARPLVATWDGVAREAYAQRQQKWTNASVDLKNILHGIRVAVDQAAQDYASTESAAEKRFAS